MWAISKTQNKDYLSSLSKQTSIHAGRDELQKPWSAFLVPVHLLHALQLLDATVQRLQRATTEVARKVRLTVVGRLQL